jgi:hypothetical protein
VSVFLILCAYQYNKSPTGSWLVKQSWGAVSSHVRTICEGTLVLKDAPKEGFTYQLHVTVAIALLIDSAATSNLIAAQVLSMLLTGRVGDQSAWTQVRTRLANIKKGLAKIVSQPASKYSSRSVEQRLEAPFWLPLATAYPGILTHAQQAKAGASATSGQSKYQHS